MEIKNRFTGKVIYSGDFDNIKELVLDAISNAANLWGADLRDANLRNCAGNRSQIKSIFISEVYPITYTSEYMQIACERHKISEWWGFDDKAILNMGGGNRA